MKVGFYLRTHQSFGTRVIFYIIVISNDFVLFDGPQYVGITLKRLIYSQTIGRDRKERAFLADVRLR